MARPARSKNTPQSTLRIIGGEWRGRRLPIGDAPGLRPTGDRVRETLFNWLAPRIEGAVCLDLFAGTGALGLEALSRGAAHVTFIERDRHLAARLSETLAKLDATGRANITQGDALGVQRTVSANPDLVFIDPPFEAHLHAAALAAIRARLTRRSRIYLEYPHEEQAHIDTLLSDGFAVLRQKQAGQVGFCLARLALDSEDSAP